MKTFRLLSACLFTVGLTFVPLRTAASPVIVLSAGSFWRYSADGTDQGTAWRALAFNDAIWNTGPAQLGFGDGDEVTTLTPGVVTAYFRRVFDSQLSGISSLTLRLLRDDGAVVYINGVEVFRNNMPVGPISYNTLATASVGGAEESTQFITAQIDPTVLVQGVNVVAVEVHQATISSGDLSFDLELIAEIGPALPPIVNIVATDSDAAESGVLTAIFPGTFTFSRSGSTSNALMALFTLSGSAENGVDYRQITNEVRFNPGQAQARVDVLPLNDGLVEGIENVVLTLQDLACAAIVPPPPGCYSVGPSNRAEVFIKDANSPPNQRPYVQLNEPQNGDVFTAPTNIVLRAFAQDQEDQYNELSVEFFAGTNRLGSGTFVAALCPAPYCPYYQLIWSNPPAGTYTLIARATDSSGASSNSAPATIVVHPANPGTNVTLVATGSVWRYLDNGSDQGAAWRQVEFNDSTWASGPAQLGYGDGDEATVVSFGPDPLNKYITTYFRRPFNIVNAGRFSELRGNLLQDDGAVVYFNGVEVFRSNLPIGPINYNTLAVTASFDNQVVTFAASGNSLREGLNVVAVEMHQNSVVSSDVSFDLELIGSDEPQPPELPVVNVIATDSDAGESGVLTVVLPGTFTFYRSPTTSNALTAFFTLSGSAENGVDYVRITNTVEFHPGQAQARVDVYPLNDALVESTETVVLTLQDPACAAIVPPPPGCYRVGPSFRAEVFIRDANTPPDPGTNVTLIASTSVWKYLDNGSDQGTVWRQVEFNDSAWASGPAQLGYGDGDEATVVGYGPDLMNKYVTTYFRRAFNVVNAASFSELRGRLLEDDGGVVYLNGVEIFRSNLPGGPILYNTLATGVVNDNQIVEFAAPGSLLQEGLNVVAVEMHQSAVSSTDLSFDLQLIGLGAPQPPSNQPPRVSITSPTEGATFENPTSIAIQAVTTDPDGYASTVEFFANDRKIGEASIVFIQPPPPGDPIHFEFTWTNPPIGQHRLTTRTVDDQGARAESNPVNITVHRVVPPPSRWVWARQEGGPGFDTVQNMAGDHAGNVYVLGHTSSPMLIGTNELPFYGSSDGYLAKYNNAGRLLWAHSFGGLGYDGPIGLGVDAAGNAYVAGQFEGVARFGAYQLASESGNDLYLAKFTPGGHVVWARSGKVRPGLNNSVLAVDAAGNSVVVGQCNTQNRIGHISVNTYGQNDAMIAKFDTFGNVLWATNAGGFRDDRFEGVAIDPAGNIVAIGHYYSNALVGATQLVSPSDNELFVAKFTADGQVMWARTFPGTRFGGHPQLAADLSGNYYFTLNFYWPIRFGDREFSSVNAEDFALVKLNTNGELLWATSAGGQGFDRPEGLEVDVDNRVVVAGSFHQNINLGGITLTSVSDSGFIAKYDQAGSVQWAQKAEGAQPGAMALDAESNVYLGGHFYSVARFGAISLTNNTSQYQSFVAQLGSGTLKQDPILTWSNPDDIVYGTPLGVAALNAQANVPGTFYYNPPLATAVPAGVGQILRATFIPEDSARYNSAAIEVRLTVHPAPLTVRADNKSKLQGAPNPPLTATYSGFVYLDTVESLDTRAQLSTSAGTDSPPGVYSIIASGASDPNYAITHINGTLTILERPPLPPARDDQEWPAVATDGENFFVIWMDRRNRQSAWTEYDIYGTRMSPTGQVLDPEGIPICTHFSSQWYPSVAFDGNNFLVVWSDDRDDTDDTLLLDIYGARVSRSGTVLDPNGFRITQGEVAYQPTVAFNGTRYLVATYTYGHNGQNGNTLIGVRVTPAGQVLDAEEIVLNPDSPTGGSQPAIVASVGGDWLVAWNGPGVQGARVSADGHVSPSVLLANRGDTWMRGLSAAGDNYFLSTMVLRSIGEGSSVVDIYGTWIDSLGQPFRTVLVSSNLNNVPGTIRGLSTSYLQEHPAAAGTSSEVFVVWESGNMYTNGGNTRWLSDIRGTRVTVNGAVSDPISICSVVQDQSHPSIAFNGQHYLAVWQDARSAPAEEYSPFGHFDIYGARVSTSGEVVEPNGFLISSASTNRTPHVQINSPQNGDVFTAPASITLNAYAEPYNATVEFFANNQSLGFGTFVPTRCATPYCPYFILDWNGVPPGTYNLRARATDSSGASSFSEPVTITVHEQPTGDRELHAVGIHNGRTTNGVITQQDGHAAVLVNRPGQRVTLFLSAYWPVRWHITFGNATVLEKVILGGYEAQTVEGIDASVPVQRLYGGSQYLIEYDIDSVEFQQVQARLCALTGMDMSSFHGAIEAPYPTPFVIDAIQNDPRLDCNYPQPVDPSELPNLSFRLAFNDRSSSVIFQDYTLAGPQNGTRLLPGYRVVSDGGNRYYYGGEQHQVWRVDTQTGTVQEMDLGPNVPELSWPMGVAFDSQRNRVLVVSLGGEGYLYGYSPAQAQWSVLSTMDYRDVDSLVYHAADDSLYALAPTYYGPPYLLRFSADGVFQNQVATLPFQPFRIDWSGFRSELASVGDYLVLLLETDPAFSYSIDRPEARMYLINPRTGQHWLAYRRVAGQDSDRDGVPDDRDQCPNTPAYASVNANGCSADQLDSDHDGVPDSRDLCPDTASGTIVDANGCPLPQNPLIAGWGCDFAGETRAPADLSNVIALAGGLYHTLALKNDGSLIAWGNNDRGQNDIPAEATGVTAIASLRFHDLAVAQGRVIAWGFNHSGQTDVPPGLSNVVAVAAGFSHSLALKRDGTVAAWGDNFHGQSHPPDDLRNVTAISAGATHSLALKADGTLVAWGDNTYGQTNIPAGPGDVVAIASGIYQSYALKRDGTIIGWGWNVIVPDGLSDVVAIAAGGDHLIALKRDHTVVSGGYYECDNPIPQPALSNVTAIAAGGEHSLAIIRTPIGPNCACDAPWRNHSEYVTCVVREAWALFRAGLITPDERRQMIRDAVQSTCGTHSDRSEPVSIHLFPLTVDECRRDGVQFVLSGDANATCILECSEDLVTWRSIEPVAVTGWEITCPMEPGIKTRFYRVRTGE